MDQAHEKVPLTGNIHIAPLTFSFLFKVGLVPLLNVTRSWTRNTKETYPPSNVYIDVEKRPWMQIIFETNFPMGFPHLNIYHVVVTQLGWNPPSSSQQRRRLWSCWRTSGMYFRWKAPKFEARKIDCPRELPGTSSVMSDVQQKVWFNRFNQQNGDISASTSLAHHGIPHEFRVSRFCYTLQCGAPTDINWFINPINHSYLRIRNHSYWRYVHQLNAIERGPHIVVWLKPLDFGAKNHRHRNDKTVAGDAHRCSSVLAFLKAKQIPLVNWYSRVPTPPSAKKTIRRVDWWAGRDIDFWPIRACKKTATGWCEKHVPSYQMP